MNLQNIHPSKKVRVIIFGLGVAILALIIFQAGVVAGYHKARFGARYGDSFSRNFVDPHQRFDRGFFSGGAPGGHGAVGEIVSIALPQMVVAGSDNLEKTVLVASSTRIREFQTELSTSDLKIGTTVVVLGAPDTNGKIVAQLIRVLPAPTKQASTSPASL